jgi:hypothetical protein
MSAPAQNAALRPQKIGGRLLLRREAETRKSTGAAVVGWLKTTYCPIIQEDPTPALAFMACVLGVMFGILFVMT